MASVDLIGPRGETVAVTDLGRLQHLVNARGYSVVAGSYASAAALLSGYAYHPGAPTEAEAVADASTSLGAALRVALSRPGRVLPGQQIATNCWGAPSAAGSTSGAVQTTAGTCRTLHKAIVGATDLRLTYGGWNTTTLADADNGTSIPISASIEYPLGGQLYRVTFGGRTVGTLDPGALISSEPVGVTIPAGSSFAVRTYVNSTAWYANTGSSASNGQTGGFTATTDLTAPGSAAVADAVHWLFGPMAITGTPLDTYPGSVAVVGDSIASGTGDQDPLRLLFSAPPGLPVGFVLRALTGTPHIAVPTRGTPPPTSPPAPSGSAA
jgi:hypothetical protein